ncbi:MAG: Mfa1 family fimbria major subunit [Tannerella sp.]|jgi:hypothetical protein|nr:Mfa1 family fimbria major subunit [Tannerella sp.]
MKKKKREEERIGKVRMLTFGFLAVCVLTMSGLAGCTTTTVVDNGGEEIVEGKPTAMAISIPRVATYADNNATSAEVQFKTADIYVYGASLEKHVSKTLADFTLDGDVYKMKDSIQVLSGNGKKIYVGLNLSAAAKAVIQNSGAYGVYQEAVSAALRDTITSAGGGFAMFSVNTTANTTFNIESGVTSPRGENKNVFPVTVARLASKVTSLKADNIGTAPNNTASGVTFHPEIANGLKFCLGNVNTKTYPLQKISGSVVEDPNYSSSPGLFNEFVNDYGATPWNATASEYVDVNASSTAITARNTKYAVENTSQSPYLQGAMTYASVRALFYPDYVVTGYNATTNVIDTSGNTVVQNDLYVFTTAGGEYLYFTSATDTVAWATDSDNPEAAGRKYLGNYKNGYCFYLIYLAPETAAQKAIYGDYATARNFCYTLNIKKFNALGYPNPNEPNPNNPLGTQTHLTVDVTIQNWSLITTEHELGPL